MKKILVTGNAGSGKSTLARQLSQLLHLPCHSLDPIVWQTGWQKTPKEKKDRRISALTQNPEWIIDGVLSAVQVKADTVVFLDVPRWKCAARALKRNLPYLFRSRPELPPGCPEILILPILCRIIWAFPTAVQPGILRIMQDRRRTQRGFHIRSNYETKAMLRGMAMNLNPSPVPV